MKLLRYNDLKEKDVPFTRTHIGRLVNQHLFPAPVKMGQKENSWFESIIDAHVSAKMAGLQPVYQRHAVVGWVKSSGAKQEALDQTSHSLGTFDDSKLGTELAVQAILSAAAHVDHVIPRDDGKFELNTVPPAGPFETRQFAEAVAKRGGANATS